MRIKKSFVYKWSILLALASLTFATVYGVSGLQRFYVVSKQLVGDGSFLFGQKYWSDHGSGSVTYAGAFAVIQSDIGKRHTLTQAVRIGGVDYVRFSFSAQTRGFRKFDSSSVFSILVFRNEQGAKISERLLRIPISSGEKLVSLPTIDTPSGSHSVDVSFTISNTAGKLVIGNPVLSVMGELPTYTYTLMVVVTLWLLGLVLVGYVAVRYTERKKALSLGGLSVLIAVAMLLPEAVLHPVNQFFEGWLTGVGSSHIDALRVSNLVHFAAFFLAGVFLAAYLPMLGIAYSLASLGLFAYFTEALQLLVMGRTSSSQDLIIDLAGSASGLFVGLFVSKWLSRRLSRLPKKQHLRRRIAVNGLSKSKVKF
jgi:VanZ family protein